MLGEALDHAAKFCSSLRCVRSLRAEKEVALSPLFGFRSRAAFLSGSPPSVLMFVSISISFFFMKLYGDAVWGGGLGGCFLVMMLYLL